MTSPPSRRFHSQDDTSDLVIAARVCLSVGSVHGAVDTISGSRGARYPFGSQFASGSPLGKLKEGEIRFFHRSWLLNDREAHNNHGDCIIAGRDISRRYTTILRQVAPTRADSALLQYPRCNKRTRLRPQRSRRSFLRFLQSARAQINGANKPVGSIVGERQSTLVSPLLL